MDALKVYDVRKICDARLYIVDMVAAFVRALATVLLMGRVAVLYRYRAVLVTLLCAQGRRPASPAALCIRGRRPASPTALCIRGRRPARSPSTPRAFRSARRLEARPGPAAALGHRSRRVLHGRHTARPGLVPALAPVLAVGLAVHIQKSPGPNGPGDSPSGWRDLNPRPLRPERSALPSCATPRCPMSIAIPRRKTQTEIGGQWEVCATPQR